MRSLSRAVLLSLVLIAATPAVARPGGAAPPAVELVETAPIETSLDHADIPEAYVVWAEMIGRATRELSLAHFYASTRDDSRLEPVIAALEAAAARGVKVRFILDAKLAEEYRETIDRLAAIPGVDLRTFDTGKVMGGVLHAKYMIVDGREAFLGSQNFDWRSLTHVFEMGVRIREPSVVAALADVFAYDWALAQGKTPPRKPKVSTSRFPVTTRLRGETVLLTPVFSPKGHLPDEDLWDLPRIVELIDGARERVRVQLLTYATTDPQGRYFDTLEAALRRAAARRVRVELLVSDWCKKRFKIEGLQSLQALPYVTVKLVTLPPWSGGFVPHARVIHAKYLVADGKRAWIGTSNWGRDYFHESRNVGLIVDGGTISGRLEEVFLDLWESEYAETVDSCRRYEPPRIR